MSSSSSPKPTGSDPALSSPTEIEKVFKRFDSNGDGKISASELSDVLSALGSCPSDADVSRMMEEIDTNKDGFINLEEFSSFHRQPVSRDRSDSELKEAFDMYDLDRNGLISESELQSVLKRLGEKCSVQDCSRMISSVDSDGDGCVNFEEFKKMMAGNGAAE